MRMIKALSVCIVLMACLQTVNADWVKKNTGTFAWFRDIQFVDETVGWIVGTDGIILQTISGGNSWIPLKKFTNDTIVQVYFSDRNNGWLLCERNIFARGNNPTSYLRKTVDGGRTWEMFEFEDGGRERVTRLIFNKDGLGTAFGEGGIFYKLQEDGKSWKKVQTAIHFLLLDGAFGEGRIGAIVGTGGTIMFSEDSGFTWEKASLIGDNDARFNSICFLDGKGAWAVGSRGRIFYSNGGARLWRQQDSTVTANLNDVVFNDQRDGWAVGDNGIIVRTRDGGKNWTDVRSSVTHRLEKITFNGTTGWAIGMGGTLLTYTDAITPKSPTARPQLQIRN